MCESDIDGTPVGPQSLPYQTTPGRSRNMAAIRRKDTKPEVELRSALHRMGYRFRKDHPIRAGGKLMRPDVAFTRRKVAVFIDGCFWHSCPVHGREPTSNSSYWRPKLERNANRDRDQTVALVAEGWTVLRFWEHEDQQSVLDVIGRALTASA
ncbi:MAG: very short patch repair endonuclease [Candidatus Nanopelagicales bacterium]